MEKYQIQICFLGLQKHYSALKKLSKYKSKLFKVTKTVEIKYLPDTNYNWEYSDDIIVKLLKERNVSTQNCDLCLCFLDYPIQNNYFTRDLSTFDEKTVLCSFHEVDSIFSEYEIDIFNYIHGIVLNELVQLESLNKVNEDYFLHDDRRNCLFDMCGLKTDIAMKYSKPCLCNECKNKLERFSIDKDFLPRITKEFKKFKKPLFYIIKSFIKENPILSILIATTSTIVINLFSSLIFNILNELLGK